MKTRMTELLGIEHPIMLAGMSWITEPGLVSAVSNAGGLGLLATGPLSPDETRKQIRRIKELTDKPFGVNQPLISPHAPANIQVIVEEKVPVVNYALGKPWFIDQVHSYGGKVIGTVAMSRHAARAEKLGCDALSVTGHEAAAHGANVTTLVLVPLVASAVKIPFFSAGGYFDGRGLAAALVLGADGISLGTRFTLTKESIVHQKTKELMTKASEEDTLYSNRFDGMPGRVAYLAGSRWPVWMIRQLVDELKDDTREAARRIHRPEPLIRMALAYADTYADEIRASLDLHANRDLQEMQRLCPTLEQL